MFLLCPGVRPSCCTSVGLSVGPEHLVNAIYLLNPFTDFHDFFTIDSVPKEDELIRYSRSWGQRSRSYEDDLKNLVGTISHEPPYGFS